MKLQQIVNSHFFMKTLRRQLFLEIANDSQLLNHINSHINPIDILYGCLLTYCVIYTIRDSYTTKMKGTKFDWIFIILSIVFTKDVRNAI